MPKRKPVSGKQRKEELQIKRAIKRGDVPPDAASSSRGSRQSSNSTRGRGVGSHRGKLAVKANVDGSRRLESSFLKFSPEFLEETKRKASSLTVERPIGIEKLLFRVGKEECSTARSLNSNQTTELVLPKRPKWRYDMSKKEVESNETAYFKRWLNETDNIIQSWKIDVSRQGNSTCPDQPPNSRVLDPGVASSEHMPYAPPLFERNLEVWRQLWRVVEMCQVLLVLLDSRCPPLHYPASLHAYLSSFRPARKVILVLTKVDIVGPKIAHLWKDYFRKTYPSIKVVTVESYLKKTSGEGQGSRVIKEPYIPTNLRRDLVEALKEVHDELCLPPPHVASDETKIAEWKPPVVREINWDAILNATDSDISYARLGPPSDANVEDNSPNETHEVEDFLSVGLIGQPNVGKSSLLNALFGSHKVKASKTPGKTKHFQTLFWSKQLRLVDCPGLVFPSFVDLEMQVLAGMLPISQIPAISSSIYYALRYIPLETALKLQHPAEMENAVEDKRTWRTGMQPAQTDSRTRAWTAMDVLTRFAEKNGWITAKAGRPDVNRAGNYILRALAEGRIKWAFYPPDTDLGILAGQHRDPGILLDSEADGYDVTYANSEHGNESDRSMTSLGEEEAVEEDGSESRLEPDVYAGVGMFSALTVEDDDESAPSGV